MRADLQRSFVKSVKRSLPRNDYIAQKKRSLRLVYLGATVIGGFIYGSCIKSTSKTQTILDRAKWGLVYSITAPSAASRQVYKKAMLFLYGKK